MADTPTTGTCTCGATIDLRFQPAGALSCPDCGRRIEVARHESSATWHSAATTTVVPLAQNHFEVRETLNPHGSAYEDICNELVDLDARENRGRILLPIAATIYKAAYQRVKVFLTHPSTPLPQVTKDAIRTDKWGEGWNLRRMLDDGLGTAFPGEQPSCPSSFLNRQELVVRQLKWLRDKEMHDHTPESWGLSPWPVHSDRDLDPSAASACRQADLTFPFLKRAFLAAVDVYERTLVLGPSDSTGNAQLWIDHLRAAVDPF